MATNVSVPEGLAHIRMHFNLFYQQWVTNYKSISHEPSSVGITSVTKEEIGQTISYINTFLNSDEAILSYNPIQGLFFIKNNFWANHLQTITQNVVALITQPNYWSSVIDLLFNLINNLNLTFTFGPKLSIDKKISNKIQQKINSFDEINDKLTKFSDIAERNSVALGIQKSQADEELEKINELSLKIKTDLQKLETLEEGINQTGLAKSFSDKSKSLSISLYAWMFGFTVGIIVISLVVLIPTIFKTYSSVAKAPVSKVSVSITTSSPNSEISASPTASSPNDADISDIKNSIDTLISMLINLLVASPAIWFTWFSAKQFSINRKLKEEYDYKHATAKAFYGYNKEASVDEELKKLLLEGTIRNFNENPAKDLDSNHRISPVEEAIITALRKLDENTFNKLIDLFKDVVKK